MNVLTCANSELLEGTSLPTKGTASLRRERGQCGSAFKTAAQCSELNKPKLRYNLMQ